MITTISDQAVSISFDTMCSEWGGFPYSQLSVLLVHLRFLYFMHQTHHWTCQGDSFYGDHRLFQRIYEPIADEIDSMAEKTIGLSCVEGVNLHLQMQQLGKLISAYNMISTIPQPTELAKRSLLAEQNFLTCVAIAAQELSAQELLTRGLDNMLQGIEDKHEGHIYLLKQRVI